MAELRRITGSDRLSRHIESEYLGAGQFDVGKSYTLTIAGLWYGRISTGGKPEPQVLISFEEKEIDGVEIKPMILNATNRRVLKKLYGGDSADILEGKKIIIYVDQDVPDPRGGGRTEGLRIRPCVPPTMYVCRECGQIIQNAGGYAAGQIVATSRKKYNQDLCADCMAARKKSENERKEQNEEHQQEPDQNEGQ